MGTTTGRRRDCMRAVLAATRATGDTASPWHAVEGVERHFDDETDLLVELHREWVRLLVARLHRGEIVPVRTPRDVRELYDGLRAENPTLRQILDAHLANPGLSDPTAREHALLARIAGLAPEGTLGDAAAGLGRTLVAGRLPPQRAAS